MKDFELALENIRTTCDDINKRRRRQRYIKLAKSVAFAGAAFGFLKYTEHSIENYEKNHKN